MAVDPAYRRPRRHPPDARGRLSAPSRTAAGRAQDRGRIAGADRGRRGKRAKPLHGARRAAQRRRRDPRSAQGRHRGRNLAPVVDREEDARDRQGRWLRSQGRRGARPLSLDRARGLRDARRRRSRVDAHLSRRLSFFATAFRYLPLNTSANAPPARRAHQGRPRAELSSVLIASAAAAAAWAGAEPGRLRYAYIRLRLALTTTPVPSARAARTASAALAPCAP